MKESQYEDHANDSKVADYNYKAELETFETVKNVCSDQETKNSWFK